MSFVDHAIGRKGKALDRRAERLAISRGKLSEQILVLDENDPSCLQASSVRNGSHILWGAR